MRLLPLVFSLMLIHATNVQAQNGRASDPPESNVLQDNIIEVKGVLPGPGFWQVSKDGHSLWILGSVKPTPKNLQWETIKLERKLAESQVLIAPASVSVSAEGGFFSKLGLLPSLLKAKKNPDGNTLQQVLPAEVYARWTVMKAKYIGKDKDIESWRPIFVAQELYQKALDQSRLKNENIVWPVAEDLADEADLPILRPEISIKIAEPKKFIKEFSRQALNDTACFEKTLDSIERDVQYMAQRGALWAEGNVARLRQIPFNDQSGACLDALLGSGAVQGSGLNDIHNRAMTAWLQMAEQALLKNASSVAIVNMAELIKPNGYLAQLQARGYSVQEPVDNP